MAKITQKHQTLIAHQSLDSCFSFVKRSSSDYCTPPEHSHLYLVSRPNHSTCSHTASQEILEAKLGQLHIRYGGREKDLGTATWFTCYEQPVWEPEHAGLGFEEGPPDFVLWLHEQEFDLRIDGSVKELKRKCFRETARTDWNGDTLVGY